MGVVSYIYISKLIIYVDFDCNDAIPLVLTVGTCQKCTGHSKMCCLKYVIIHICYALQPLIRACLPPLPPD